MRFHPFPFPFSLLSHSLSLGLSSFSVSVEYVHVDGRGRFRATTATATASAKTRGARTPKLEEHDERPFGACTPSRRAGVSSGYFEQYYGPVPGPDCSSRRRGNLAEGCNSRRGCFSATRIGSGEGRPGTRERRRRRVRRAAGMRAGTLVTSASKPAGCRAPRPWQFSRPVANCSCRWAASYEALRTATQRR